MSGEYIWSHDTLFLPAGGMWGAALMETVKKKKEEEEERKKQAN